MKKNRNTIWGVSALALIFAAMMIACNGKAQAQSGSGGAAADLKQAEDKAKQTVQDVKGAAQAPAGKSPQDALKDLMETAKDIKPWETEVTETLIDRAVGYVQRGKTNLKITGPVTKQQLYEVAKAMDDYTEKNSGTLFKLDLSAATGLTDTNPDMGSSGTEYFFNGYGGGYLGSIILPEGLKTFGEGSLGGQSRLVELRLPDSLESYIIGGTREPLTLSALPKLVIPGNARGSNKASDGDVVYHPISLNLAKNGVVVFKDGPASAYLPRFDWSYDYKIVLPPSLTEFSMGGPYPEGNLDRCAEIYSYAPAPPAYVLGSNARNTGEKLIERPFKDVKTIYVPAASVKAYEDAWFNYTGADFKPIPANLAAIDRWY